MNPTRAALGERWAAVECQAEFQAASVQKPPIRQGLPRRSSYFLAVSALGLTTQHFDSLTCPAT
jgi:hypothetical protein